MTCPYASTCLASRLPTDNICATCTIREALERGAAEREAFLRETYPRPGDMPERSPICPKCGIDERTVKVACACNCEVTP